MTKSELNGFRKVLEIKEGEWSNAIRNRAALVIEVNSEMLDQIQHSTERELELDRLERESNLLRDVRAALRRIDTEVFGFCLSCEDEISPKRLAAVPWTQLCIACQETVDSEEEPQSKSTLFNGP
jgi:DnaK suppressor protein